MKVIKFNNEKENGASEVAKELYNKCKSGEVSAFITSTIDKNNDVTIYVGNNVEDSKSVLECLGAVFVLQSSAHQILLEMSEEE